MSIYYLKLITREKAAVNINKNVFFLSLISNIVQQIKILLDFNISLINNLYNITYKFGG